MTSQAPQRLTRALVAERLKALDLDRPPAPVVEAEEAARWAYREAAAVLVHFEPAGLRPFGLDTYELGDAIRYVAGDCSIIHDPLDAHPGAEFADDSRGAPGQSGYYWMLADNVRFEALERLIARGDVSKALTANVARRSAMQELYEACLAGKPPDLANLNVEQLSTLLQIARWLSPLMSGMPTPEAVSLRLSHARLLTPFTFLAGQHFYGREEELRELREYVGVLPPETLLAKMSHLSKRVLGWKRADPLMIYGVGGIGKSALLGRFLLEHAELPEHLRFPFAYIDFDRPELSIQSPVTLLSEAARQLAIQYPAFENEFERYRAEVADVLLRFGESTDVAAEGESPVASELSLPRSAEDELVSRFADLVQVLGPDDQPLLLVLDTFEELQYRSRDYVRRAWRFLESVQNVYRRLRVVVAGRVRVTDLPCEEMPLEGLSHEAAVQLLAGLGVDRELADEVARRLGTSPLTLRLAARVLSKEEDPQIAVREIRTRGWLRRFSDERIQGELYRRHINHIHDSEVRRLAHPGLIVRLITIEVIREILAEPCGLEIKSVEHAGRLFDELRREVAVVAPMDEHTLRHRPEVRRVMIEMLREDKPDTVEHIHYRAVAYYETRDGRKAREEELYHRLALDQPREEILARWDSKLASGLVGSIEELPPRAQAFLAAEANLDVSRDVWRQADLPDWERYAARRVDRLVSHHEPKAAWELLCEREDRTPTSPLHNAAATVLLELGQLDKAMKAADEAVQAAREAGDDQRVLEAQWLNARIRAQVGDFAAADQMLAEADRSAGRIGGQYLLKIRLDRLRLARRAGRPKKEIPHLERQLHDAYFAVPKSAKRSKRLVWDIACELGADDAELLYDVVRSAGLPSTFSTETFAQAMAKWDEQFSRRKKKTGALARLLGVKPGKTPQLTWSKLIDSRESVVEILMSLSEKVTVPKVVLAVVANDLRRSMFE